MNLESLYDNYCTLEEKKNLSGKKALEAVKKDGYALQYVSEEIFLNYISKLPKEMKLTSPSKQIRAL